MRDNADLLSYLESTHPHEVYRVKKEVDPRECGHSAYEEAFRERGKHPWVIFENVLRADGSRWEGLFSNCNFDSLSLLGIAYGLDLRRSRPFDLIVKHHRGMTHPSIPRLVDRTHAPVKELCN